MKQKNLSVLSLLASFMLLIFAGSAFAQTEVTLPSGTVGHDCDTTLVVAVTANEAITCFDMIVEMESTAGGAFGDVYEIVLHTSCGTYDYDLSKAGNTPDFDTLRFWGCALDACCDVIPAGTQMLAEIKMIVGSNLGTFTFDATDWSILEGHVTAVSSFLNGSCEATALTVNPGTITVANTAPYFTNCPTALLEAWCSEGMWHYDFDATDDDCVSTLTYSIESGGGTIDDETGEFSWYVGDKCGLYNFRVVVEDEYGETAFCDFELNVKTEAPYFTYCPDTPYWIALGETVSDVVTAEDPDLCPDDLAYSLISFDGPGTFDLNGVTGEWSWATELDNYDYVGSWTAVIEASDGCESAECSLNIVVSQLTVAIPKLGEDPDSLIYQGHYYDLPVWAFIGAAYIGGYDLLIEYDPSALTFVSAVLGDDLVACEWEYFTFRYGNVGNCGGPCPSGLLRIVAMEELNDGANHPSEQYCATGWLQLAKLQFFITNDRTYEGQYVPVGFHWFDCGDNALSNVIGDTLWIDRQVYLFSELYPPMSPPVGIPLITDEDTLSGWQALDPFVLCTEDPDGDGPKWGPIGWIDFYFGGFDIASEEEIDLIGDINLNNVAHEIADAVLFTNYFIYGTGVFSYPEGSIAASDVNNDGIPLTVGDLVYLIRVITGDALPFAKLTPFAATAQIGVERTGDNLMVSSSSNLDLGAAYFVFSVNGTAEVTPLINGMDIKSDVVDGELRVLVYNIGEGRIPAGTTDLFSVNGDVELVESSVADYYGNDMNTTITAKVLPSDFALLQNYPNPFNPATDIVIDLPGESEWKLDIYNVTGQLVKSFSGYSTGGQVTVTWNAGNAASGVYFYKATAGQYSAVKKMVLMK